MDGAVVLVIRDLVTVLVAVTDVPYPITVLVFLIKVRVNRAVVFLVRDGVPVVVTITGVADPIAVAVLLLLLGDVWAEIFGVDDLISVAVIAGVTALTLAYIGVRAAIVGVVSTDDVPFVVNPMVALGPVDRFIDAFANTGRYVALSLVPGPFSADYAFDAIPVGGGRAWSFVALGVTTTAAVVLAAVRARTTAPHLTWLGLWFLGAAAFVSNGPFLLPSIFAERMFYAATIPGCALLGLALVALVEHAPRWRLPIRVTVALLVGLQTISCWYHAGRWRDEATLFEASLVAAPRNARLREFAARAAIDNNDPVRALAHLERALAIEPERVRALALHGVVLDMLGEPKRAVSSFREAMRINPTDGEPADLFIQFLLRYGHLAQARAVYETHRTSRGGTPDPGVQDPALRPRNTPTP